MRGALVSLQALTPILERKLTELGGMTNHHADVADQIRKFEEVALAAEVLHAVTSSVNNMM